jgi:hypothetical protein
MEGATLGTSDRDNGESESEMVLSNLACAFDCVVCRNVSCGKNTLKGDDVEKFSRHGAWANARRRL